MKKSTSIFTSLEVSQEKEIYDDCAKRLLSHSAIAAWILKGCVDEFAPYSVEFIAQNCIDGAPIVAEKAVNQDEPDRNLSGDTRIEALNSESSSIDEQTIYYDIRMRARVPNDPEPINLIINIEMQNNDNPGYAIVSRGLYYCARMISEQYGTVFRHEEYDKLQKVYSIWICPNAAKSKKNRILKYKTTEDVTFGGQYVSKKSQYDLMEVVILYLGDVYSGDSTDILQLLGIVFSSEISLDEKRKQLESNYRIPMTYELEREVSSMCNLSDGIYEKGRVEEKQRTAIALKKAGMKIDDIVTIVERDAETVQKWINEGKQNS